MDTEFELEWHKSKDKKLPRLFWNKFKTSEHSFFPACHALKTWFELSRVKLYRNDPKRNKNFFQLAGGLSSRGSNYSKRKSKRNRLWFELARVRVITLWLSCWYFFFSGLSSHDRHKHGCPLRYLFRSVRYMARGLFSTGPTELVYCVACVRGFPGSALTTTVSSCTWMASCPVSG